MLSGLRDKINNTLTPVQPVVTVVLVGVTAACLYMAFKVKDPTARTAFAAWMIAP